VTKEQIALHRLRRQHLAAPSFTRSVDVVRSLGAVQAQDYAGAKWAIGQRAEGLRDADIERDFNAGAIIRTHVLRPTWHFVAPEDIRWMLALTAPRVRAAMKYYDRILELDAKTFRRSNAALTKALRDGAQLTRAELTKALVGARVKVPTGQHVGHLLMQAELDGVICSGARRGKQFTYALLDERVPPTRQWDRGEALLELTRRYFTTRGPATLQDFSWWSGLTVAEAKGGVESAGSFLERETSGGCVFWFSPLERDSTRRRRSAHLLPNYDEYFIGLKDRSAIGERLRKAAVIPRDEALMGHILVVHGQLAGRWSRALGRTVDVNIELLLPLTESERSLVRAAAERFGEFLGLPANPQTRSLLNGGSGHRWRRA
jgi:hypothetical protein